MSNLRFGEFTLDRALRQLTRGQEVLPVYGKCFDLLVYMADNPGRPLLKSELLTAVWPDSIVEEANLSQNVSQLRKVVGSGSDSPIVTLPGRGYQFAARVTELLPDVPSGATFPKSALREPLRFEATHTRVTLEEEVVQRVYSRPRFLVFGMVAVSLGILGLVAWFGWQRWLDHNAGSPVSVILTSMDGTTGDPILDRTLTDALRIDLAQSPFVSPVSQSAISATLTQMRHKPDDNITVSVARELCERTNSQAVVHSAVARSGTHFLLTEEASSCIDGKILAQAKQEAPDAEDLPHRIDKLAASLRHQLGESRRSVAHFDTPLFADNTASLNALKAETHALSEISQGKVVESIGLFKSAIAEDPNYATAYYGLAAAYGAEGDDAQERTAIAKAYSLRESATRPVQFAIVALYNALYTQDLYENLRNQESWIQLYPNSGTAWNGLSNLQRNLGDYAGAVVSSRRATELLPTNQAVMRNLATGQLQSGDLKAAGETCQRAIAAGMDDGFIHTRLLESAYVLHDAALLRKEAAWAESHADAGTILFEEASIAVSEGRFGDAQGLVAHSRDLMRQQGLAGAANEFAKVVAFEMIQAGDVEAGKRLFEQEPVDLEEGQDVVGLVYAGKTASAFAAVRAMQTKYPQGTLWNLYWGPSMRALADMAEHHSRDALAALEAPRPIEMRELFVPWLRGTAYLASGEPSRAESEFRTVVTHPEIDPTAVTIPLSWLGLGRALAAEGKLPGAIEAYDRFLGLWSRADADALNVRQARQELVSLTSATKAN